MFKQKLYMYAFVFYMEYIDKYICIYIYAVHLQNTYMYTHMSIYPYTVPLSFEDTPKQFKRLI